MKCIIWLNVGICLKSRIHIVFGKYWSQGRYFNKSKKKKNPFNLLYVKWKTHGEIEKKMDVKKTTRRENANQHKWESKEKKNKKKKNI